MVMIGEFMLQNSKRDVLYRIHTEQVSWYKSFAFGGSFSWTSSQILVKLPSLEILIDFYMITCLGAHKYKLGIVRI